MSQRANGHGAPKIACVPMRRQMTRGLAQAEPPRRAATIKEGMYERVLDVLLNASANEMDPPSHRSLELGG